MVLEQAKQIWSGYWNKARFEEVNMEVQAAQRMGGYWNFRALRLLKSSEQATKR